MNMQGQLQFLIKGRTHYGKGYDKNTGNHNGTNCYGSRRTRLYSWAKDPSKFPPVKKSSVWLSLTRVFSMMTAQMKASNCVVFTMRPATHSLLEPGANQASMNQLSLGYQRRRKGWASMPLDRGSLTSSVCGTGLSWVPERHLQLIEEIICSAEELDISTALVPGACANEFLRALLEHFRKMA